MICKECKNEMIIDHMRMQVRGDTSPDTQTRVYEIPIYKCRAYCPAQGREVEGEEILVYPKEEQ